MTFFRNFTAPLWEIFGGNLLMVVTIGFYIAWWVVSFRPGGSANPAGAGVFLVFTLLTGMAAISSLVLGISSLSQIGKGFPLIYFLVGAVALYILLLIFTQTAFQRQVTAELLLIVFWAVLEWSEVAVLLSSGQFNLAQAITVAALILLAAAYGMVCYVIHYRLEEPARFWNGVYPLVADAGVVVVFLGVLALG